MEKVSQLLLVVVLFFLFYFLLLNSENVVAWKLSTMLRKTTVVYVIADRCI